MALSSGPAWAARPCLAGARFRFRTFFGLALVCTAAVVVTGAPPAPATTNLFRVGFSANVFSDVNANDAMAALKVWAEVIAKERGIPMDPAPSVLRELDAIRQALRSRQVDALALNTDEYWRLRQELDDRVFVAGVNKGQIAEEYLVLVHQDSAIHRLEDLHGHEVTFLKNSRMSLAIAWLDTLLVKDGLPRADMFCRMKQAPKLSKVVLPVFFRQTHACVVTRRGFETMGELNPQVGQRLRVLASSPEVVPSGFCFRRDYDGPLRETIITELQAIMRTPAGAQILTLFQSGSLKASPISCLDGAFELLKEHEGTGGGSNALPANAARVAVEENQGGTP